MVDDRLDRPNAADSSPPKGYQSTLLAATPSRAGEVRPLAPADVPAVASLYHRVFLNPSKPAPSELSRHLERQFLTGDPSGISSLVYIKDGAVAGFVGAMPLSMSIDGRTVQAATIGSFMVDRHLNDPLGGAKLLRAMAAGPQDITLSETASSTSLTMWRSLRGTVLAGYSLDWLKVLSPARYLTARIARRLPLARLARPVAGSLDRVIARRRDGIAVGRSPSPAARGTSQPVGLEQAAEIIRELSRFSSAGPDWSGDTLERRLASASTKSSYGQMTCRAVAGPGGATIGLFIYHARRFDIGHVLQVLARPGQTGLVLDQLFQHAAAESVAALTGRTDPTLLDALLGRDCSFANFSSTVVSARDKSLLTPMLDGRALLTGLAGETWSPFAGHDLETI